MACSKRERTGSCGHHQCPASELTGYQCVDLFEQKNGHLACEVGSNCIERCPYSFPADWTEGIDAPIRLDSIQKIMKPENLIEIPFPDDESLWEEKFDNWVDEGCPTRKSK